MDTNQYSVNDILALLVKVEKGTIINMSVNYSYDHMVSMNGVSLGSAVMGTTAQFVIYGNKLNERLLKANLKHLRARAVQYDVGYGRTLSSSGPVHSSAFPVQAVQYAEYIVGDIDAAIKELKEKFEYPLYLEEFTKELEDTLKT